MKYEITLFIIALLITAGFIAATVRRVIVKNRKIDEWERDELANPEKYLADDEIVFVKYKKRNHSVTCNRKTAVG